MPLPAAIFSFNRIPPILQQFEEICNFIISSDFLSKYSNFTKLKADWWVLKMFSESMQMLSIADAADLDGEEYLYQLALKIDAAFEEIANDPGAEQTHIKIRDYQDSITNDDPEAERTPITIVEKQNSMLEIIWPFINCYGTKFSRLAAEIGEALDLHLSSSRSICCSWSFLAHSPARPHVSLLLTFAKTVSKHLGRMIVFFDCSIGDSDGDIYRELRIINRYIEDLDFSSSPGADDGDDESSRSTIDAFLSSVASVVVNVAIKYCNYLIHRKSSLFGSLKDLHRQIDPTNPKFIELHINLLIALDKIPGYREDFVKFFCSYLFRYRHITQNREAVYSLIISFLDSRKIEQEDVVQSFRQEITAVLLEVATSSDEAKRIRRVTSDYSDLRENIDSSNLLAKICLAKAELCLRQQIRKFSSSRNSNGFSSDVISNCRLEIEHQLYDILKMLRSYFEKLESMSRLYEDSSYENLEYERKTINLVEQIHKESLSLLSSFQLKHITEEYKLKNSLLLLLLKTLLFRAEPILLELSLQNNSSSSAAATVMDYGGKDRIAILLQLLEYFKQILSNQKLNEREDVYMPLVQIEIFARGVACFSYSFHRSKITEDMIRKMYISSCEVLDKVKHLDSKANEVGPQVRLSKFPKTYKLGFIDFFVRNLGELLKYDPASIAPVKHHVEEIQLHLKSLTSFLRRVSECEIDKHPELKNLDDQVTDIAYKLEYIIDLIEIDAQWHHFFWFYHLLEELKHVNKESSRIHLTTPNIANAQNLKNVTQVSPNVVVDLSDEEQFIIDQLTRGSSRRTIVSIVGMPGIGKTTMAGKVYNNQNVMYHFHHRAWCTVSQAYDKRELLLEILSDIHGLIHEVHQMSNEDLESKLRQCLLKNRYLIVIDDIWQAGAWNDLQNSFPDDVNGSRILITSRHRDVALERIQMGILILFAYFLMIKVGSY